MNYKRVERVYQEVGLQVLRRKRKKVPVGERQRPSAANEVWSMDFVFDRTAEGRVVKCVAIVDDATQKAVAIEVERAISGQGVSRVLDRLAMQRGLPRVIRTDNGKEFCGKAMVAWAHGSCPASDRTWQTEPKCLRGVLQQAAARRMPQRALVPDIASCPYQHRKLAA